jgi:hypothetical protein
MNEIEKSSIRKKNFASMWIYVRKRKRFLTYLSAVLLTVVFLKGFQFVEERVSREMYQLCIILFVALWGFGLLMISKHEK